MPGQRIGYVRVSSFDQNPEQQLENVSLNKVFTDKASGRKKALSPDRVADLRQRASAGEQKATLAREFGISRETLYQYLRSNN